MAHEVVRWCAVLALVCNAAWAVPQAVVLVRSRTTGEVSPATWAIAAVSGMMLAHSITLDMPWPTVLAGLGSTAAALTVLAVGAEAGWPRGWLWTAIVGVVLTMPGIPPYDLLLPWLGALIPLPQLLRLSRARSSASVSTLAWVLSMGQAVFWVVPLAASDEPVWPSLLAFVLNAAVVVAAVARRRASVPVSD